MVATNLCAVGQLLTFRFLYKSDIKFTSVFRPIYKKLTRNFMYMYQYISCIYTSIYNVYIPVYIMYIYQYISCVYTSIYNVYIPIYIICSTAVDDLVSHVQLTVNRMISDYIDMLI